MSDVIALVQVDEQRISEGGTYDSDDPRVQRNPQWFSSGEEIIDREFTVAEVVAEPEPSEEPGAEQDTTPSEPEG